MVTLEEARLKLSRFIKEGYKNVTIYSRREQFAFEACVILQEHGYLGEMTEEHPDHQSTIWVFPITPKALKKWGYKYGM